MKKFTMLVVGVLASTLTFAVSKDDNPKSASGMIVVKQDESSYKLIYKSEEKTDVKVQIFDAQNALIFSETIRHSDGFSRPYNFINMAEGNYTIKLDNGSGWQSETVNYKFGVKEKPAQLITLGGGRYLLAVPGTGKDNLSITIEDSEGREIHKRTREVNGNFSEVYNLSSIEGAFTLQVTGRNGASKTFSK